MTDDTTKSKGSAGAQDSKGAKSGLDDLVASVVGSMQMTSAIEQAVQKNLESALSAAGTATADLIKNNVQSPELAQENLKLQKAVIDKTIAAIKALGPDSPDTSK